MPYEFFTKVVDFITNESFRTHKVIREKYNHPRLPYLFVNQFLSGAFINIVRNLLVSEEDWDPLEISEFFTKIALNGINGIIEL